MEIWYFFITDNIKEETASIAYCPAEDMVADFLTKPLQRSLFQKFFKIIMGLDDDEYSKHHQLERNNKETDIMDAPELPKGTQLPVQETKLEAQECVKSLVRDESCLPAQSRLPS